MSNIQKHIRRLRVFFQFLLIAIPVKVIAFWAIFDTSYDFISDSGFLRMSFDVDYFMQFTISNTSRFLGAVANLMIASVAMYALMILIRLFRNYEKGDIFSLENVMYYQKLGYSLFYWVFGGVIYGGALSVILSFNNPPGERSLTLTFVGLDFLTIVLGFLILIIARVMKEGQIIADENRHTI